MFKKNLLLIVVLVFALSLSGCFSFLFGGEPTELEVSEDDVTLNLQDEEQSVTLAVVVKDNKGKEMEVDEDEIEWVIDDEDVAVLSVPVVETESEEEEEEEEEEAITGFEVVVTAVAVGETEITITWEDLETKVAVTVIDEVEDENGDEEDENLILFEDFGADSVDHFFSADYKSLPGDDTAPLYVATSGQTKMELSDGKLKLGDARFAIGMPADRVDTTEDDEEAGGVFDFSKPYRITVEYTDVGGDNLGKKFQIYIDNNTSSGGNSLWASEGSTASRPFSVALEDLPDTIVCEPEIGTESSFIQIRQESDSYILLDSITIEYLDEE